MDVTIEPDLDDEADITAALRHVMQMRTAEMLGLPLMSLCLHRHCARGATCRHTRQEDGLPLCIGFLDEEQLQIYAALLLQVIAAFKAFLQNRTPVAATTPEAVELQEAAVEIILRAFGYSRPYRTRLRQWYHAAAHSLSAVRKQMEREEHYSAACSRISTSVSNS